MANTTIDQVERPTSQPAPISTIGKTLIITLSILTLLATFICVCRILVRKRKGYLGPDDWLLMFALVVLYVQDALNFVAVARGGVGIPTKELMKTSIGSLELLFVILYACEIIYCILMYTLKASILISYYRIFSKAGWVSWAIKVMFGLSTVWFIIALFMFIFRCQPIQAAWKPLKVHGKCIDLISFIWGVSITNFMLDWMILLLPIVSVVKLQLSPLRKALVIGSFFLGSIACIASTTRTALTSTMNDGDLSKSGALVMIWTVIEPACGIISACLPFLARIFSHYLRSTGTKVIKGTGELSRRSDGAAKKKYSVLSAGTMIEAGTRITHKTNSSTEYKMHQLHVAEQYNEEQESVRNLIV